MKIHNTPGAGAPPAGAGLPISFNFGDSLGPHTLTTRVSYTVPAGKQAIVSGIATHIQRTATAGTLGDSEVLIGILPSGGSLINVFRGFTFSNVTANHDTRSIVADYLLLEGDELRLETVIGGVGGLLDLVGTVSVVEF